MSEFVYVSAASAWEAEIKQALGKLVFVDDVAEMINANGFIELPVSVQRAACGGTAIARAIAQAISRAISPRPVRPDAGCASAGGGVHTCNSRSRSGSVWRTDPRREYVIRTRQRALRSPHDSLDESYSPFRQIAPEVSDHHGEVSLH